jgi:hypothetical protein
MARQSNRPMDQVKQGSDTLFVLRGAVTVLAMRCA